MTADYQTLLTQIQTAIGGLELDSSDPLRQTVTALSQGGEAFRIVVFGPFNYGKSTLLNALLGERTLPMDLIPTTGAAILVRYCPTLQTQIRLKDSRTLVGSGTELLQEYAILDNSRRMRDDVAAVEVGCPHPWLQTGIELLDLPGTNDREAQDDLVRESLLSADLVVQILDGRKLMTLGEREHLRDWLQDRGIETVLFVVNFLNLLEVEEQQQVTQRMRFVAESFRADLPAGVSNLYRVDALPALRAKLKGDGSAAQTSGLPMLETALQAIAQAHRDQGQPKRARIVACSHSVCEALRTKIKTLSAEIDAKVEQQRQSQLEIQRKAQAILQKGYRDGTAQLRDWAALPNLLQTYGETLTEALRSGTFLLWETQQLRPDWELHRKAAIHWVHQACEFFKLPQPADLWIAFIPEPTVKTPDPVPAPTAPADEAAPVAIATGLGLVVGGPIGAAVLGGASYLLNRMAPPAPTTASVDQTQTDKIYRDAAAAYLTQWSQTALEALEAYEQSVHKVIHYPLSVQVPKPSSAHHQLQFLQSTLEALEDLLRS